ncbi:MAG: VWA domain-containing protein, partial [Chloroflexi bacterium CFX6]|nr:VWA domain-containing protein [Chloroflexi bacterium CFX6]
RAAERARAAGVTVFTIGLGADVDGDLLAGLAGDPSRYAYAPDAAALGAIYRRVAEGIPCR